MINLFFDHSEVDTKPKLIDFVIELKQSKIKVEEKVKEFIKEGWNYYKRH